MAIRGGAVAQPGALDGYLVARQFRDLGTWPRNEGNGIEFAHKILVREFDDADVFCEPIEGQFLFYGIKDSDLVSTAVEKWT